MIIGDKSSIPKNWGWTEAQEIMDVRDGTHDSPKSVSEGIPLVTSKNLKDGKIDFSTCSFISEVDHQQISRRSSVDDGDILYAMIGTIGNPVLVEKKQEFSIKNVALFKFNNPDIHNKYIFHFLQTGLATQQFAEKSRGGTQKFVSLGNIRELQIPLPNGVTEQKHIAAVLDKAEALKQKRQQALALADEYLRATFLDLFGDLITNPKGWPVHKISDLCSMDRETITSSERNGLPYLGLEHIESQTGRVLVGSKETIDHEVKGNSFHFNSGHILYGKLRPYLNKVALPSFEGISSTELVPLKTNSEIANRYFVAEVLRSKTLVETVMNANQGARMPRTNMNFMLSLEVGLPPKPEQDKFEQIVKKVEALKAKMQASQTDIEQLAKSLSQKAFRGELPSRKEVA